MSEGKTKENMDKGDKKTMDAKGLNETCCSIGMSGEGSPT